MAKKTEKADVEKCVHKVEGGTLAPMSKVRPRHLKCSACFKVFWWDGPSLFTKKDLGLWPHRKQHFSDDLIPVSADGVELLVRT